MRKILLFIFCFSSFLLTAQQSDSAITNNHHPRSTAEYVLPFVLIGVLFLWYFINIFFIEHDKDGKPKSSLKNGLYRFAFYSILFLTTGGFATGWPITFILILISGLIFILFLIYFLNYSAKANTKARAEKYAPYVLIGLLITVNVVYFVYGNWRNETPLQQISLPVLMLIAIAVIYFRYIRKKK